MSAPHSKPRASFRTSTKRGDTIVEVMFAIAIFSLVAVLSISMMNLGVAASERSLELVTARSEINAQAEALRFIHSSYSAELTLPTCTPSMITNGEKCQQFRSLWQSITSAAVQSANGTNTPGRFSIELPLSSCDEVYKKDASGSNLLQKNNAFVLNTRQINMVNNTALNNIYISSTSSAYRDLFREAPLGARIVYIRNLASETYDEDSDNSSAAELQSQPTKYLKIGSVEGIWVVAVRADNASYYDFYIQSCWVGASSHAPTSLDTVIRLSNPDRS